MSITTERPVVPTARADRSLHSGVRAPLRPSRTTAAQRRATAQRRRYVRAEAQDVVSYGDSCVTEAPADRMSWPAMVLGVIGTAVVILGLVAVANLRAASLDDVPGSAGATQPAVATVAEGETINDVARRVAPNEPVQRVVDRILELNQLGSAAVTPGQQLVTAVGQ